ncbi:MAG TPA: zinc ribbon domain-containing protein [Gemmatimonadaceae bacterium]
MPTYEFRCPTGHEFEKFYRSIGSAPSVVACPECGKTAERQLSAGGGLVFKGSGFYITDYGKDGKKAQASSPPSSDAGKSAGGADAAAKGESGPKPAGSNDSKASAETKAPAAAKPATEKSSKRAKDKE